jgi:hypothetical protein
MTDDRDRSSSSEELLREARRRVHDGDLYSDDHLEASADAADGSYGFDEDGAPDEDDGLSAAEIAEQLAESRERWKPTVREDAATSEPDEPANGGMSSLTASARDDDPATDGSNHRAGPSTAPSGLLSERIRALSMRQQAEGEVYSRPLQTPPPPVGDRDPWTTPSPEWQSRPEPTPPRSSMAWIRPVLSLIAIAVFGIGILAARFDGTQPIDQLSVGDCFNPGSALEVYSVPVIDCDELHEAELFGTVEIDAFGADFPGDDAMYEWVNAECEDRFFAYVGEAYAESRYWIEVFYPTEAGWGDGDRTGLCTVVLVDEDLDVRPALGSARNWGAST